MHDDRRRAEPLGRCRARWSFTHGSVDQTRCVISRQGACTARIGHAVVVGEAAQRLDVLADRIGPHHDLDAVVAEARGDLEGRRRGLRIDGGRGQGDLRIRVCAPLVLPQQTA